MQFGQLLPKKFFETNFECSLSALSVELSVFCVWGVWAILTTEKVRTEIHIFERFNKRFTKFFNSATLRWETLREREKPACVTILKNSKSIRVNKCFFSWFDVISSSSCFCTTKNGTLCANETILLGTARLLFHFQSQWHWVRRIYRAQNFAVFCSYDFMRFRLFFSLTHSFARCKFIFLHIHFGRIVNDMKLICVFFYFGLMCVCDSKLNSLYDFHFFQQLNSEHARIHRITLRFSGFIFVRLEKNEINKSKTIMWWKRGRHKSDFESWLWPKYHFLHAKSWKTSFKESWTICWAAVYRLNVTRATQMLICTTSRECGKVTEIETNRKQLFEFSMNAIIWLIAMTRGSNMHVLCIVCTYYVQTDGNSSIETSCWYLVSTSIE